MRAHEIERARAMTGRGPAKTILLFSRRFLFALPVLAIIYGLHVFNDAVRAESPCQKECEIMLEKCIRDCGSPTDSANRFQGREEIKPPGERKLCIKKCYSTRRDCWKYCDK